MHTCIHTYMGPWESTCDSEMDSPAAYNVGGVTACLDSAFFSYELTNLINGSKWIM